MVKIISIKENIKEQMKTKNIINSKTKRIINFRLNNLHIFIYMQ